MCSGATDDQIAAELVAGGGLTSDVYFQRMLIIIFISTQSEKDFRLRFGDALSTTLVLTSKKIVVTCFV